MMRNKPVDGCLPDRHPVGVVAVPLSMNCTQYNVPTFTRQLLSDGGNRGMGGAWAGGVAQ